MSGRIAYIGLGSNLGGRREALRKAVVMMGEVPGVEVLRVSELIETDPAGGPAGQGKYLNGVAEISTTLAPRELLVALHEIERACGRDRQHEERWGERTCDLDILLMGDTVMGDEGLTIPHPRLHERLFVLAPLASLAGGVVHPVLGKTVDELLAAAGPGGRGGRGGRDAGGRDAGGWGAGGREAGDKGHAPGSPQGGIG